MSGQHVFDFLDYLVILVKWKKLLFSLLITLFVISYLLIFFFVEKKYDATTLIVPSEQESVGNLTSILKSYSAFPSSLTGLRKGSTNAALFKTLIYSRSALDSVISTFNIMSEYQAKTMDETRKALSKNIVVNENDDASCEIICRTNDPVKSAKMANYVVELLNRTIIELEIRKTKDNRTFLENRYSELRKNVSAAEDSLRAFQTKSGFFVADEQTKASIETYVKFEADIASKEIEYSVMQKMYGGSAVQTETSKYALAESRKMLADIKSGKTHSGLFVALQDLPVNIQTYLRLVRNVKIYNSMLEFILPLCEQARFDEQKKIPILQIIDRAVPPEERSYPHRVVTALLYTFAVFFMVILLILFKEVLHKTENEKIKFILSQFRKKKNLPA